MCLTKRSNHSFSWLTADEMLEWFDGGVSHTKKTGVVDRSWYETWDGVTEPDGYSGWVSGKDILVLEQDNAAAIKAVKRAIALRSDVNNDNDNTIRDHLTTELNQQFNDRWLAVNTLTLGQAVALHDSKCTHVQISWQANFKEELSYFFDEVKRLKELHGDVRMVFGFDS